MRLFSSKQRLCDYIESISFLENQNRKLSKEIQTMNNLMIIKCGELHDKHVMWASESTARENLDTENKKLKEEILIAKEQKIQLELEIKLFKAREKDHIILIAALQSGRPPLDKNKEHLCVLVEEFEKEIESLKQKIKQDEFIVNQVKNGRNSDDVQRIQKLEFKNTAISNSNSWLWDYISQLRKEIESLRAINLQLNAQLFSSVETEEPNPKFKYGDEVYFKHPLFTKKRVVILNPKKTPLAPDVNTDQWIVRDDSFKYRVVS